MIQIPKLRAKKFIGQVRTIYRAFFLFVFCTQCANIIDNFQDDRKGDPSEFATMGKEPVFILSWVCNCVVIVFLVMTMICEYHYLPFGRGWLLFFLWFFKTVVVFWDKLKNCFYRGSHGGMFVLFMYGNILFAFLCTVTQITYQMVQTGLKNWYKDNEKTYRMSNLIKDAENARVTMLEHSKDFDIKVTKNILTDFKGYEKFIKKIEIQNTVDIDIGNFVVGTSVYDANSIKEILIKIDPKYEDGMSKEYNDSEPLDSFETHDQYEAVSEDDEDEERMENFKAKGGDVELACKNDDEADKKSVKEEGLSSGGGFFGGLKATGKIEVEVEIDSDVKPDIDTAEIDAEITIDVEINNDNKDEPEDGQI